MHSGQAASCPEARLPFHFGGGKAQIHDCFRVNNIGLGCWLALGKQPLAPLSRNARRLGLAQSVDRLIAGAGSRAVVITGSNEAPLKARWPIFGIEIAQREGVLRAAARTIAERRKKTIAALTGILPSPSDPRPHIHDKLPPHRRPSRRTHRARFR